MFIVGGAMGPKNMNTKFNGGDYGVTSPEVWSDDVSPVRSRTVTCGSLTWRHLSGSCLRTRRQ